MIVRSVKRVCWSTDDAKLLRTSVIIGRCRIELADGRAIDALLCASTRTDTLGDRYAVFFDEATKSYRAVAADPMEPA
jgi:hypothetical protein